MDLLNLKCKSSQSRFKPSITKNDGYIELEISESLPAVTKVPAIINSSVIRNRQQENKKQFDRNNLNTVNDHSKRQSTLFNDSFKDLLSSNTTVTVSKLYHNSLVLKI